MTANAFSASASSALPIGQVFRQMSQEKGNISSVEHAQHEAVRFYKHLKLIAEGVLEAPLSGYLSSDRIFARSVDQVQASDYFYDVIMLCEQMDISYILRHCDGNLSISVHFQNRFGGGSSEA